MAIAVVAHIAAGSVAGGSITTGEIDTTGATLLTVVVSSLTSDPATLADSKTNTWQPRTAKSNAVGASTVRIYDCVTPVVGTGHTFTAQTVVGNCFPSLAAAAWSGTAVAPFDGENGTNDSFQPGSVTPSQPNALVIQGVTHVYAGALGIDGGYTIADEVQFAAGLHFGGALAYLIQTAAAATNPTWSGNPAMNPAAVAAVYLARIENDLSAMVGPLRVVGSGVLN